jgi:hypothetical protein
MQTPTPAQYAQLGLQIHRADAEDLRLFGLDEEGSPVDYWIVRGMTRCGRRVRLVDDLSNLGYLAAQTAMSLIAFIWAADALLEDIGKRPSLSPRLEAWVRDPMGFDTLPETYYKQAERHSMFGELVSLTLTTEALITMLAESLETHPWVASSLAEDFAPFLAQIAVVQPKTLVSRGSSRIER